jgi:hypothetical protein
MPWLEMLVLLALVLLNGYFAMAEFAVVAARPTRLEALARQKASRGASRWSASAPAPSALRGWPSRWGRCSHGSLSWRPSARRSPMRW